MASIPTPHLHLSSFEIAVEVLGLSITVVQSPFTGLSGLRVEICHLADRWDDNPLR